MLFYLLKILNTKNYKTQEEKHEIFQKLKGFFYELQLMFRFVEKHCIKQFLTWEEGDFHVVCVSKKLVIVFLFFDYAQEPMEMETLASVEAVWLKMY